MSGRPATRTRARAWGAAFAGALLALAAPFPASVELEPLDAARLVAARYPGEPGMRYIPALIWSGALRLTALTGEPRWEEQARRGLEPFLSGAQPAISPPYLLTSLAGHLALSDLGADGRVAAATALASTAAEFILPGSDGDIIRFPRGWTDDMFMASALLSRVGGRSGDARYARAVGRLLTAYGAKLQRPDGLFIHAVEGPFAWGRGNGFAALGALEALTYLPDGWPDRTAVLEMFRRHMRAMLRHQDVDGSWRQVVDDASAYRELTVTAMTTAALARGVRRGWLDRDAAAAAERGWRAVLARVSPDAMLRDVCPSTGAGATSAHYLTRPPIHGADDRGAAMALLAALEIHELRAARSAAGTETRLSVRVRAY